MRNLLTRVVARLKAILSPPENTSRRTFLKGTIAAAVATLLPQTLPTFVEKNYAIIPLVRKMYPNMIASMIVGVQPMTAPAGQIFTIKSICGSPLPKATDNIIPEVGTLS